MCTWAPTPRVQATFTAAFPHVIEAEDGEVLIGSLAPIALDLEAWAARAATALAYLGPERTKNLVGGVARLRPALPAPAVTLNRDLFPRDEYAVR